MRFVYLRDIVVWAMALRVFGFCLLGVLMVGLMVVFGCVDARLL